MEKVEQKNLLEYLFEYSFLKFCAFNNAFSNEGLHFSIWNYLALTIEFVFSFLTKIYWATIKAHDWGKVGEGCKSKSDVSSALKMLMLIMMKIAGHLH